MTKKLTQDILLTLLAILLSACSPQNKVNPTTSVQKVRTVQCIAQQSQCQFDLPEGQVQVLFDVDRILAEEAFTLVLNYQGAQALTSISGHLEGVNMYMGKIPLFIKIQKPEKLINNQVLANLKLPKSDVTQSKIERESKNKKEGKLESKQVFQAEVLVGSCSAEQMTWRIWLTFTTSENKTYTKMLTVASYRS